MARSIQVSENTYAAGTYGPFNLDSFTNNNTDAIVMTMTVVGWPAIAALMIVTLKYNNGDGAVFSITGTQLNPFTKLTVPVFMNEFGKRPVSGATATVQLLAQATTAISMEAI